MSLEGVSEGTPELRQMRTTRASNATGQSSQGFENGSYERKRGVFLSSPAGRALAEERVVCVARRVRLRLEESVEVPERALNKAVRRHLLEPVPAPRQALLASHQARASVHSAVSTTARSSTATLEGSGVRGGAEQNQRSARGRRGEQRAHPSSRNTSRNCERTFMSGCR